MKSLLLLRHAQSATKESRQDDRARPLTQAGIKDALHMGAWMSDKGHLPDLIVTSSAVRAEETANLLCEGMKLEHARMLSEDVLYEASVRQMLDYVNNIEDCYHRVVIVAHNPTISYFAEYLTKAEIGSMQAGALALIRFEAASSWKEVTENTGTLERHLNPETVARY